MVKTEPVASLAVLLDRTGGLPEPDRALIQHAHAFAERAHTGQNRVSGEPFIGHPLAVAGIVADLGLDGATIAAALLHDVVEDTGISLDAIRAEFGDEVAMLVDGLTKLARLPVGGRAEEQAENLRKMLIAMARDIRVILIKLADRLHNMRTLEPLLPEQRQAMARETLEIYAPIAHRLGIFRLKWELEDLALRFLQPDIYAELARRIPHKRQEREEFAAELMADLRERLKAAGIGAEVSGRAKHFYSIYEKMYEQGHDLSQIYDLIAVRVIVESVRDCYNVLGIVHATWKPMPGRFKDYVAMPKSNMYQSLHTTVIGPRGEPFEIQIRTWAMHRTAEYGIAAHWKYKEGSTDDDFDRRLVWVRDALDWQRDLKDPREFMESLKLDIFSDEVFVFTPKGDVIQLPAGSTPIDFAYHIHTEIGHHCVGAKINGRIVTLDRHLENGDIVEVLTHKQAGPSADWLAIVRTSTAKNRIRQWFKRERRDEAVTRGRESLQRECRRLSLDPAQLLRADWLEEAMRRFSYQSVDDLMAAVGFGSTSAAQVVGRLRDQWRKVEEQHARAEAEAQSLTEMPSGSKRGHLNRRSDGVKVRGIDNVLVRFGRCCNPVPGDPIVGYVTRGRGVSIHHPACPNLLSHRGEEGRLIEVAWEQVDASYYPVEVEIHGLDRPGLLSDVTQILADTRTNIIEASARGRGRSDRAVIGFVLEIKNLDHLENLRRKILKVRDVYRVDRVLRPYAQ
ncbi:MAG TPA: bifunctional (p)ppGpp synthetase/guanosine-3',5'-bis(diphosphate) 3'-pyrophosphohydrolase [Bacillota bacterium]|nr:bifunctional (p)ppGpp synthetase/guanosine-3',5'-bis(diphosphate) 3'-pyrophosphohydrolase [Bacillota bacterium]